MPHGSLFGTLIPVKYRVLQNMGKTKKEYFSVNFLLKLTLAKAGLDLKRSIFSHVVKSNHKAGVQFRAVSS